MSLNISENNWVKAGLITALIIAIIGVWLYLAGGIFMMVNDQKYEDANLLTLYQYWYYYGNQKEIQKWLYISSGLSLTIILSPLLIFFAPAKKSMFGNAQFATRREIKKSGLLGEKGIIVGKLGHQYLTFDSQQHALISAPTRGWKGVAIVIPNLLNWPESVVALDIKQENFDITSGYRQKYGQNCYLFNPAAADYRTHCYNPLAYISEDSNFRIDDVQKIANMLFPDQAGTDVIWTATPRSLFLGIVLFLSETPDKPLTIGQVLRETLAEDDGSEYFSSVIKKRLENDDPLSNACVRALNSYISITSENTRAGVMTSFRSRLELWMNPLVDAATSANDFDLREVRKRRMSIYVSVTPDNLERMAPLLNLFFQQLIDLNTRQLPSQNKSLKYTCLLLMDEFTAIGKVGILSKGISYIAGYGLRMLPIIQSPAQLVEVYGKDAAQTFTTNHALNIVFAPKASETQTAKDISEWLGYQTVKGKSESKGKDIFTKRSRTESVSDQRRALLLPQEITNLGQERELIVMEYVPPILAKKVCYYKEHIFINRLKEVSPMLRALKNKLPTHQQMDDAKFAGELKANVPLINMAAHQERVDGYSVVNSTTSKTRFVEYPVTPEDIPKLAKLNLENFSVDFSAIETPKPDELDEAALHAYADNLCIQAGIKV